MPKLNPKNIKNKVKHIQKYLPNPPKMGTKSLPGSPSAKSAVFTPNFRPNGGPMGAQRELKNH